VAVDDGHRFGEDQYLNGEVIRGERRQSAPIRRESAQLTMRHTVRLSAIVGATTLGVVTVLPSFAIGAKG
jgi:hypothetical protein